MEMLGKMLPRQHRRAAPLLPRRDAGDSSWSTLPCCGTSATWWTASVTPGVSWEAYSGAPGGTRRSVVPGSPGGFLTGSARVACSRCPVSIEWSRDLPSKVTSAVERLPARGWIARALRHGHILRPVWLRPYPRFDERKLVRWWTGSTRRIVRSGTSCSTPARRSPGPAATVAMRVLWKASTANCEGSWSVRWNWGARPTTLSEAAQTLEAAGY
jgi:hypothetical protein